MLRDGPDRNESALILAMMDDKWKIQDIAAYFNLNQGRCSRAEIEKNYPGLTPAATDLLPQKHAFSGKESLFVLRKLNGMLFDGTTQTNKLDDEVLRELLLMRQYPGHKWRSKPEDGEGITDQDYSLALTMIKIKKLYQDQYPSHDIALDKISAFFGVNSARIDELADPEKYKRRSEDNSAAPEYRQKAKYAYNRHLGRVPAPVTELPPLDVKNFYPVFRFNIKYSGELMFPSGYEMDQILKNIEDLLECGPQEKPAMMSNLYGNIFVWAWKNYGELEDFQSEKLFWEIRLNEIRNPKINFEDLDLDTLFDFTSDDSRDETYLLNPITIPKRKN